MALFEVRNKINEWSMKKFWNIRTVQWWRLLIKLSSVCRPTFVVRCAIWNYIRIHRNIKNMKEWCCRRSIINQVANIISHLWKVVSVCRSNWNTLHTLDLHVQYRPCSESVHIISLAWPDQLYKTKHDLHRLTHSEVDLLSAWNHMTQKL